MKILRFKGNQFRKNLKKIQKEWINEVFNNEKLTLQWKKVLHEAVKRGQKKPKPEYDFILTVKGF